MVFSHVFNRLRTGESPFALGKQKIQGGAPPQLAINGL